jgi:arabinosyltransferase C
MLLAVPWAILAAIALARELQGKERQARNLVAALGLAVVCLTSVFWLGRDLELARGGVSKTVVHNLFLSTDEDAIVQYFNGLRSRPNVLAMPGFAAQQLGEPAFLNDFPPVVSGLTGAYSYAGHWSETPEYPKRRNDATRFFIEALPIEVKRAQLQSWGIDYVIVPDRETFWAIQMTDLSGLGEVVYDGPQLDLVKTRSR